MTTDKFSIDFWYADLEIIEYNDELYCNSKDKKVRWNILEELNIYS